MASRMEMTWFTDLVPFWTTNLTELVWIGVQGVSVHWKWCVRVYRCAKDDRHIYIIP